MKIKTIENYWIVDLNSWICPNNRQNAQSVLWKGFDEDKQNTHNPTVGSVMNHDGIEWFTHNETKQWKELTQTKLMKLIGTEEMWRVWESNEIIFRNTHNRVPF